jgi:hypothetical protein
MAKTVKVVSFEEALAESGEGRHLLLGNGFSRALRDDIFSYRALFESADFSVLSDSARESFTLLGTTDFEVVMRSLRNAATLLQTYAPAEADLRQRLRYDADGLRELLASTIARNHPERPSDVTDEQFESCRRFLGHFKDVYTVNYDLLLYWALMHKDMSAVDIKCDDGFRTPEDGPCEYVTWEVENTNKQNVYFLHGALHVFDAGVELKKFTWINTGVRLIEQIRAALQANMYPLIVAEGTSQQKLEKIQHSNFLSRTYRSFANIQGTLTVLGHSMGETDEHILRLIQKGKLSRLWVGLHGDPSSSTSRRIISRSEQMKLARTKHPKLEVGFFDATSAKVWTS